MSDIPHHVAIILDGNRRWAKQHGKLIIEGHRQGALTIKKLINVLRENGTHTITVWIFSTENWSREKEQVFSLMRIIEIFLDSYFNEAIKDEVRIIHLGRKERIPDSLRKKIVEAERKTAHFTEKVLNIGLDYGGRDEIIRAIHAIKMEDGRTSEISEKEFEEYLDTKGQKYPFPDMIIRTGGEMRMSGFMTWQGAYAEYFFEKKYLPDMKKSDILRLLKAYKARKRRFGK